MYSFILSFVFYNKFTKRDFGGRLFFLDPGTRVSHKAPTFEDFSFDFRKYPTVCMSVNESQCVLSVEVSV